MILNYKKLFYLIILIILVFLIIYNWSFLSNIYNYKIYKENCIITKINDKKNYEFIVSNEEAVKFCDCKVESFKKENIEIFISKLRVQKKFISKEKIIDKKCKDNLKIQNLIKK